MPYGQKTISRKCYKGSILFSVLLLFLLCTFLLMAALESYRLSMDLNIRIKNYYIAKIMKQMALSEQSTLDSLRLPKVRKEFFTTQLDL